MIAVSTDTPGFVTSIGFSCGESKDGLEIAINALALQKWVVI